VPFSIKIEATWNSVQIALSYVPVVFKLLMLIERD
jgi:hypothetical protein